jgi:hypothetical protein
MDVPNPTTVQRPSWSIPVDQVAANVSSSLESIMLVQGGLASVDLYCTFTQVFIDIALTQS